MKSWRLPKGVFYYALADYLAATISWILFVVYRRTYIESRDFHLDVLLNKNIAYGILLVPVIWLMIYIVLDSYRNIYRMSRLTEILRTLFASIIGAIFLFFTILLDDLANYSGGIYGYYTAFTGLLLIHISITLFFRLILLTIAHRQIKNGKVNFKTIFIGYNQKALEVYKDITSRKVRLGNQFVGYIETKKKGEHPFEDKLPCLGTLENLNTIIIEQEIEEVILALDQSEHTKLRQLLNTLDPHSQNLLIKVIPDMYDILLGKVKMQNVYGAVLIEIKTHLIPVWLRIAKRGIDLITSLLVLTLFSPLYLFTAIKVRLSSKGPILYQQERIGLHGKPFMILKFRSMYTDAEKRGPQLSTDDDDRCTPWGKTMRKYRLDEIPQFWNVLRGDMSLVGPRPERQFYIDKIAKKAPHVHKLHKVRPGITSWGQVKYGYASNVDEMIQRLKFDILYIENLSLSLDIKILFYTVLVILKGSGK